MSAQVISPRHLNSRLKLNSVRLHRVLGYLGFVALLLWGGSGLLHPWLSTFGVQQAVFAPPVRELVLADTVPLANVLGKAGITQAVAVRVVVGQHENLLQVTQQAHEPRRYFSLRTGHELHNHDPAHAAYLARHHLNVPDAVPARVQRIDSFSSNYPAVNRLLPVYHVSFQTDSGLNAYVYTETGALAAVSDHTKAQVQQWFQWLHTWSWLPTPAELPRVLFIAAMVGALLLLSLSGLSMLVFIRRKARVPGIKGMHRFAAYFTAIPVLAFTFSGVLHLVQHAWPNEQSNLRMTQPISLGSLGAVDLASIQTQGAFTGLSLLMNAQDEVLIRLALPAPKAGQPLSEQAIRSARFDGIEPTGPALYLTASTGQPWPAGDRAMALHLATQYTGLPESAIEHMQLVTRFGGAYDFRNKRLPVWQVNYGAPLNAAVFVDTATGVLADITPNAARFEQWVFSQFHKWSFLGGLGRNNQNIIISVSVVLSMLLMAGLGFRLKTRNKRLT